jgi:predicted outer membrane repeat protein
MDGFYIEKGNANLVGYSEERHGAGMYFTYSKPTLKNIVFRNNYALWHGAGIYAKSSALGYATLINVLFINNTSGYAGAALSAVHADIKLTNVIFTGNTAPSKSFLSIKGISDLQNIEMVNVTGQRVIYIESATDRIVTQHTKINEKNYIIIT